LQLYSIDARTKNRYIVAEINEWRKISHKDYSAIIIQHPNLIYQMQSDLGVINNGKAISAFNSNAANSQLFNIMYKDFTYQFNLNKPLSKNNQIYNLHRFFLYR